MRSYKILIIAPLLGWNFLSMRICSEMIIAGIKMFRCKREWIIKGKHKSSISRWSKLDRKVTKLTLRTSDKWAVDLTRIIQGKSSLLTISKHRKIWKQEMALLMSAAMIKWRRSEPTERLPTAANYAKCRRRRLACLHLATKATSGSTKTNLSAKID